MVCEQYGLGAFSAQRGATVATLLPMHPTQAEVMRAGYCHLVGSHKRNPLYVSRVEARLARQFPEDLARFCEGWQTIATDGSAATSVWASAL